MTTARAHRAPEREPAGLDSDRAVVEALRRGEQAAFVTLVERHQASMERVAACFVSSRAAAQEVVQDTWLAVLAGLDRFEARSSLRTWIFAILVNRARSRRRRDVLDDSTIGQLDIGSEGQVAVDGDRFSDDAPGWRDHWRRHPRQWGTDVEARVLSQETQGYLRAAIEELPPAQRIVIQLRDVDGWPSRDVCTALDIQPGYQRVLLHRARSRVRAAVEEYVDGR